jgi:hypothetical protein
MLHLNCKSGGEGEVWVNVGSAIIILGLMKMNGG